MVPLQVYNSLQNEEEKKILFQIKNLIIGGGAIDKKMEEELKDAPNNVWSTYGMTETLSHIALRKINGNNASEWYTPFKEVSLQLTDDQTLRIIAPTLCDTPLDTNDIAEINANGDFKIIGRKDNTVISGGVKIHVEEVERLLGLDADLSFAIGGIPNEKFGQILVALTTPEFENTLKSKIPLLPKYFQPKKIFLTEQIPTTENGKIDRKKLREILKENSMT
jgi:O-succinylbenzoic acid--CoA ligase